MRGTDRSQRRATHKSVASAAADAHHPLRPMRSVVDDVLKEFSTELSFAYSAHGRPSVPPEKILRALVLQVIYGISSERLLLTLVAQTPEFRWFVGLAQRDRVWHPTTLTKNRARLRETLLASRFLSRVLSEAEARGLLRTQYFQVNRAPVAAWSESPSWTAAFEAPRATTKADSGTALETASAGNRTSKGPNAGSE